MLRVGRLTRPGCGARRASFPGHSPSVLLAHLVGERIGASSTRPGRPDRMHRAINQTSFRRIAAEEKLRIGRVAYGPAASVVVELHQRTALALRNVCVFCRCRPTDL